MSQIFLSAGIPDDSGSEHFESADPFLIQFAVRELLTVCLGRRVVVWGGHPAITPMVWAVCESLGVDYASQVRLYQSKQFEEWFPEANKRFKNVTFTPAVRNDRAASLEVMRRKMLSGPFGAAVFIGGMGGIFDEYRLFKELNPMAKVLAVSAPGGASAKLAKQLRQRNIGIDFARLFHKKLGIAPTEPRDQALTR